MTTMNDEYGDGSGPEHVICEKCGYCLHCGDCQDFGCGKLQGTQDKSKSLEKKDDRK